MLLYWLYDTLTYLLDKMKPVGKATKLTNLEKAILREMANQLAKAGNEYANEILNLSKHIYPSQNDQCIEFRKPRTLPRYFRTEAEYIAQFTAERDMPIFYATFRSKNKSVDKSVRADVFWGGGRITRILLTKPPTKIFGTINPDPENLEVIDLMMLFEPAETIPFCLENMANASDICGSLGAWAHEYDWQKTKAPLSDSFRDKIIRYYKIPFPEDYLGLISFCEYAEINNAILVYGLSQIYTYMTPNEYIHVLAELKGNGVLCLIRNGEPGLYYINNEDHIPIPIGDSIMAAMNQYLSNGCKAWRSHL